MFSSPEPPRHLAHPPPEVPTLSWWSGHYDAVWIALNPFFRVPGASPLTEPYGPHFAEASDAEDLLALLSEPSPNPAADGFEDRIKTTGQPLSWTSIHAVHGGPLEAFLRAVWLSVVHADRPERDGSVDDLLAALAEEGVYPPEQDTMPAVMEPLIARFLAALNIAEVTVWNDWRDESAQVPRAAFEPDQPALTLPGESISALSAPGFLISWSFDDVYAHLALSRELADRVDPSAFFEVVTVEPHMYSDWLNPHDFVERVQP